MTDPTLGAADPDMTPPPLAAAASAEPATASGPAETGAALAVGRRWRNYQITSLLPAPPAGCYLAQDVGAMEEVVLLARAVTAATERRRATWEILSQLPGDGFVRMIEAHEEGGVRHEISALPPGPSLRDWMASHQASLPTIEAIVHQLTTRLETLHQAGLVHLNLRPETVYVRESEQEFEVVLGGLHEAVPFDQPGLVPIEVNPYYAPAEAGGLYQHPAGETLCAWDWWALGRLVQEIVLGRHAYGLLFERDVRANPPELRARAEALLLERDASGIRAGAVELLPEATSARLRQLLRGLLTSARDGRWQGPQVQAWLRGETPPDRYALPRDARLFVWERQALTLPEAADIFARADFFVEGLAELFPEEAEAEGTLRQLLEHVPQYRADLARVRPLWEMIDMPAWQEHPLMLRRAAVAGLVWLTLADPARRRPLVFGARPVNAAGLQEMLLEAPPAESIAVLGVLTAEPYVQLVQPLDAAAGRALHLLARVGREVTAFAAERGWAAATDPAARTRLLRWVLATEKELLARRDRVQVHYASNADAALAGWLGAAKPSLAELVLLAYTGERPENHGYITHEEWSRRRHAALSARAERIAAGLFWLRLERVVALTPALFGAWPVSAAIWLVPVALAGAAQAWGLAGTIAALAIAGRTVAHGRLRSLVARHAPDRAAWGWTDRAARCRREAQEVLQEESRWSRSALAAEFARLGDEIARLPSRIGAVRPAPPPWLGEAWCGAALSLLAPIAFCGLALLHAAGPPAPVASTPALAAAGRPRPESPPPSALFEETGPDGKPALYERDDDGFGRHRRGPLKRWDVPKPAAPTVLTVAEQAPASAEQRAFAAVSAELLLAPYPREGLAVVLAVSVPVKQPGRHGIVLYDSAKRTLADDQAYQLAAGPAPASWYYLAGREVVYLGQPKLLRTHISLAEPPASAAMITAHDRTGDIFPHRKHQEASRLPMEVSLTSNKSSAKSRRWRRRWERRISGTTTSARRSTSPSSTA